MMIVLLSVKLRHSGYNYIYPWSCVWLDPNTNLAKKRDSKQLEMTSLSDCLKKSWVRPRVNTETCKASQITLWAMHLLNKHNKVYFHMQVDLDFDDFSILFFKALYKQGGRV